MKIPSLLDFISCPVRRARLAERTATNKVYLWQVATGWRGKRASPELAIAIDKATRKRVPKEDLRPDLWPTPRKKAA